jgi:hypothetical protein
MSVDVKAKSILKFQFENSTQILKFFLIFALKNTSMNLLLLTYQWLRQASRSSSYFMPNLKLGQNTFLCGT